MAYFDENRDLLHELFVVLGKADDWSDDAETIVAHTLPRWLGAEHGPGSGKEQFPDGALHDAWPLLRRLGVIDRVDPARDRYDEIVVMGAAGIGLHRRLELVRTSGVRADGLTVLAGLRPHSGAGGGERSSGLARDGSLGELLAPTGRFAPAPGWRPPARQSWQQARLRAAGVDDLTAAQIVFPSETDLAELLVGKQWPDARVTNVVLPEADHPVTNDEFGQRSYARLDLASGSRTVPWLRILNGAPVDRGEQRPPRPTSRSTFAELLDTVLAERRARHLLVVVNQPHLARVGIELRTQIADAGRDDLRIDLAGCESLPTAGLHVLLGELPAWIKADGVAAR
jgi:hypothetical protein